MPQRRTNWRRFWSPAGELLSGDNEKAIEQSKAGTSDCSDHFSDDRIRGSAMTSFNQSELVGGGMCMRGGWMMRLAELHAAERIAEELSTGTATSTLTSIDGGSTRITRRMVCNSTATQMPH
ncbi:MAG: hypothetical protein R2832_15025 [Rhodothermales bacterium]